MSLTGIFLVLFLVIHLLGNLQLFNDDLGYSFNIYARFMTTFVPIKIVSYALYALILIHITTSLILTLHNRKSRGKGYKVLASDKNSAWSSRNMGLLGTIILIFLVVHMGDFWFKYKFGYVPYKMYTKDLSTGAVTAEDLSSDKIYAFQQYQIEGGKEVLIAKDLYQQVQETFSNVAFVLLYLISMVALGFHLLHGFFSAFQTLGWASSKYEGIIRFLGIWVFSVLIPLLFALMPVYFYLKAVS